jgi:hypothetical protein
MTIMTIILIILLTPMAFMAHAIFTPFTAAEEAQIGRPSFALLDEKLRSPTKQEHSAGMLRFMQDRTVL